MSVPTLLTMRMYPFRATYIFKVGELLIQRYSPGERIEDDRFWLEQAFHIW